MRSLIYIIIVVLAIGWVLGYFAFHVGGSAIHILIVIAIILLFFKLIGGGPRSYRGRS